MNSKMIRLGSVLTVSPAFGVAFGVAFALIFKFSFAN